MFSNGLFPRGLRLSLCGNGLTLYQTTKFLDWFKSKHFQNDTLNVAEKLKFVLGRVENIAEKGENAG